MMVHCLSFFFRSQTSIKTGCASLLDVPGNCFAEVQVVGAIDPRTGVQVKGKPDPQAESPIVGSIPDEIKNFRTTIVLNEHP